MRVDLGADGVVLGLLDEEGRVDVPALASLSSWPGHFPLRSIARST